MSTVIQFPRAPDPRYARALGEARAAVDEARSALSLAALNLAMAGPWREWDEQQPVGAVLALDEDALRGTGDRFVTALAELIDALDGALLEDCPF